MPKPVVWSPKPTIAHKGIVRRRRGTPPYNRRCAGVNYVGAGLIVAALVGVLRLASVEHSGIAAPLLLLAVVVVARFWGTGPALLSAASAAASFSYYFLPPEGFGIDAPDDWVAFVTFLVTAIVAGELASRAERRTAEAEQGRQEIQRLYQELHAAFERASEAEAARRNEQLKAALLDALRHNLRTPLTGIKAAVTALIGAGVWAPTSELSSEGERELLQVIDEESDRLNRFIEGLSSADQPGLAHPPTQRSERLDDIVRAVPGARREPDPRTPRDRHAGRPAASTVGRPGLGDRSALHAGRQREQVRARPARPFASRRRWRTGASSR